jgi:hypothetical protein
MIRLAWSGILYSYLSAISVYPTSSFLCCIIKRPRNLLQPALGQQSQGVLHCRIIQRAGPKEGACVLGANFIVVPCFQPSSASHVCSDKINHLRTSKRCS